MGRTVASEAVATGNPAVASSFRFHRPRGPLCGHGHCGQCEIATEGGRALACMTPAGDAPTARGRDPLRPLGRIAESWTPWFYERRFLRPAPLRRLYLEALRRLSAAPALGPAPDELPRVRALEERSVEVVVVGPGASREGVHVVDLAGGDEPLGVYDDRTLAVLSGERLLKLGFERLVLATGGYERLPPIRGNDLPGVLGLAAAERYGAAGGLPRGTRIAAWTQPDRRDRVRTLAKQHGLELVWMDERAPEALAGRGRVERLHAGETVACDLFLTAVVQPAIELALQAGATARLTAGELPILVAENCPDWLELEGDAARRSSGVPDVAASDDAFACLCEDVRVGDLRACVAQGFDHAELVKRRTGAMTGPCQGKLCAAAVHSVLRDEGVDSGATTARPLARPVELAELAADA
jgi:sarcosine oxidase alpha subunit family protein/2Fe-2S iron-sulfur cluster protein